MVSIANLGALFRNLQGPKILLCIYFLKLKKRLISLSDKRRKNIVMWFFPEILMGRIGIILRMLNEGYFKMRSLKRVL